MFWSIYIASSLVTSLLIAKISKEYYFEISIFLLIVLITPTQIEISLSEYSPALFTFIFNILFEQNFSTRVLRPLLITLPLGFFSLFLCSLLRRKFF